MPALAGSKQTRLLYFYRGTRERNKARDLALNFEPVGGHLMHTPLQGNYHETRHVEKSASLKHAQARHGPAHVVFCHIRYDIGCLGY